MEFLKNIGRWLFDFSQGQAEGRMFERMIRVALTETRTEREFLDLMYHMLQQEDRLKTETRWSLFKMRMSEYARGQDPGWRVRAERLLADIPHLYGYKPEPSNLKE